jgi:lysophospholipase L1-like esterase
MNIRYLLGAVIAIPLLPIMYLQGGRIRKSVPSLPEATGPDGSIDNESTKTIRIVTLGESTIAGVGVSTHQQGFTGTLAKELASRLGTKVKWSVIARSGYTVRKMTERLVPQLPENGVDIIVVGAGGNDAFTLRSPRQWHDDIQLLIASIKAQCGDVPIVFINMPPIKEFPAFTRIMKFTIGNLVDFFGEKLIRVAANEQRVYFSSKIIRLADWIHVLGENLTPADFFSDGVHPSELTYQTWAKDIGRFIDEEHILSTTQLK